MTDKTLRSKIIRLAHENPELRDQLLPLVTKQAGGTAFDLFPKDPIKVGARKIKKVVYDSNEYQTDFLASLDFRKIEFDKPEKNPYRNSGTLVWWRVYPKGSYGDRNSDYVYGYIMTEWDASSSKGVVIEGTVVVKH